jgi:ribosomal-protein-alanine N-acetyltransferase
MHVDDLPAVMATENVVYPFPWTQGNFVDSLAAGHSAWVASEMGRMVGYGIVMLVLDEAHLLNLSIVAERQRSGLGGTLLEYLCSVARQAGATRMFLEVRPSNAAGLGLYRRHGFAEIGRRRGYYPGHERREDAVVMARDL